LTPAPSMNSLSPPEMMAAHVSLALHNYRVQELEKSHAHELQVQAQEMWKLHAQELQVQAQEIQVQAQELQVQAQEIQVQAQEIEDQFALDRECIMKCAEVHADELQQQNTRLTSELVLAKSNMECEGNRADRAEKNYQELQDKMNIIRPMLHAVANMA